MSNRNYRSDESIINLKMRGENNNRNNINNCYCCCNNFSYRRPSYNTPPSIKSDTEPEAENNYDDNPPSIECVKSDTKEEGENILVYEGNFSDKDSKLLEYTAEISGVPIPGVIFPLEYLRFQNKVLAAKKTISGPSEIFKVRESLYGE
ncbi:hypothetical protein N7527_004671 [Penicillium freii]|nr:hypothetical protein N7527_004671 [Penicillium freii]